ncbi:MAG: hypothetical protein KDC78_09630 [Aequorivita sp.]|nr:hypothetical protein [Aequorivita sp.]
MIKRIILLILIIFVFKGCTKDDICPEDAATTSNLVIVFKDIANPANNKKVVVLSVLTNNIDSTEVIRFENTDSIIVPLNTNSDTTKYLFKRSIISTTDTINNIDKLMFIYQRKNNYVSRACGFKTEFDNLDADLELEGTENWIEDIIVNRQTVNDENSAHVTLLH